MDMQNGFVEQIEWESYLFRYLYRELVLKKQQREREKKRKERTSIISHSWLVQSLRRKMGGKGLLWVGVLSLGCVVYKQTSLPSLYQPQLLIQYIIFLTTWESVLQIQVEFPMLSHDMQLGQKWEDNEKKPFENISLKVVPFLSTFWRRWRHFHKPLVEMVWLCFHITDNF